MASQNGDAVYSLAQLKDEKLVKLMQASTAARKHAYAPYSKFAVGAAVLTSDGRTFTGCNVENASTGLGICAEVVAISKAVSEGAHDIEVVAVTADAPPNQFTSPCGRCRQFIAEFMADMSILIYMQRLDGTYKIMSMKDLLPMAFTPRILVETTKDK